MMSNWMLFAIAAPRGSVFIPAASVIELFDNAKSFGPKFIALPSLNAILAYCKKSLRVFITSLNSLLTLITLDSHS